MIGHPSLHTFPTRRSSDLGEGYSSNRAPRLAGLPFAERQAPVAQLDRAPEYEAWRALFDFNKLECAGQSLGSDVWGTGGARSEEHTSELQSLRHIVCRLLL